ncbi:MAG TPA: VWA domain-containing protein [Polyangiaceae bacterium LLY-WYZ-15_(1-7)]|nr:VWA domain-containing protein [Polyangiaceae bacterium LLY-WYZ-15_(1-7)]
MHRLIGIKLGIVVVALAAGCADGDPAPLGGGDGLDGIDPAPIASDGGLGSPTGCFADEPAEGCACDPGTEPVSCYTDPVLDGGDLLCGAGTRYCQDGVWGACEHVEEYTFEGFGTFSAGTCNHCNPDCTTATDRPDDDDLTEDNSDNVEYDPSGPGITIPPSTLGTPTSTDTDRDGIPDLADDCPRTPGVEEYFGCPPDGTPPGIYHELPFGGPVEIDPCEINVQVRTVDVYFLMDTTGSMGGEIANLRNRLTSGTLIAGCGGGVIGAIRCEIPDAWFGVGYHDDYPVSPWGWAGIDDVYRHLMDMADNPALAQTSVNSLTTHYGYDWPESQSQALYAVATGNGLGGYLGARGGCPAGRWGYPCFRPDAIPVVILFTDAPFHNGTIGAYNYTGGIGTIAASASQAVTSLVDRGVKVISIESSGRHPYVMQDLQGLSFATNSVNAAGAPFIFSIPSNGSGLDSTVVNAVRELADYSRVDVSAECFDNPATPGFDECDFVESIVARSVGPRGSCNSFSGARFLGCLPGTDTNFEVSFRNDVVEGTSVAQVYEFWIRVLYNDSTVAYEKPVRIVIPPAVPACATVEIGASRIIPNVMFLVDESGSMGWSFPGATNRWLAVRNALVGGSGTGTDRGIIGEFEEQVRFGLQTYTSSHFSDSRRCSGSAVRGVDSMILNNFPPINTFYRSQGPGGGTPTAEALEEIYDQIIASPPADGPPIVILATDGEPNGCARRPRDAVVAQVQRGFAAGIRTFVISVGTGVAESHLQDVANAGVGVPAGAPYWVATDASGLETALAAIIRGEISCEMDTDGVIDEDVACFGEVRLSGRELACEDPDGWRRVDDDTIELLGAACLELQTDPDATVTGSFPCPPVTGSYWRVYDATSTCEIPPTRPSWGDFTWTASTPSSTTIAFEFRTAATEAGLAAATPMRFVVPTEVMSPPVNLDDRLRAAGLPSNLPYLQMTAILSGSVDRTEAPVLTETNLDWTCIPME